ncbi:MAG: hypothetical protein KC996_07405, partial [Phycisphaerales bacterium]|nr:hypothetical protein [Phycisphaerales bacterium]
MHNRPTKNNPKDDDAMTQAPATNANPTKADSQTAHAGKPTKAMMLKWLHDMQLIREFENRT